MYVWFNGVMPTKENKAIKQRDTASQHLSPGSGMHETVGEEEGGRDQDKNKSDVSIDFRGLIKWGCVSTKLSSDLLHY